SSNTIAYTPAVTIIVFFLNLTAPTEIYTLSLHDALPISIGRVGQVAGRIDGPAQRPVLLERRGEGVLLAVGAGQLADDQGGSGVDGKSTRLNSSHVAISYAVFCLKKKTTTIFLAFRYIFQ